MPKSYRIRTQVGVDKSIKVNLDQDFDSLNILSLKILQSDIYNRQCSDYGVVVGRVFANGGFGLPNARVSIFIPVSDEDSTNPVISELYPYTTLSDVNEDGYRYNLLPKKPSYTGHAATGTFPDRGEVLLDQTYVEVYDKYYKFTTRTNESGDYMIFGVPLGSQTIFSDIDLSDMGCFSLSPQDLIQAGQATESQVNGSKFKSSTNLNELPQIKTLNKIVDISPLWGEPEICNLGITRVDFDLTSEANVSIRPTAVFMGSIISTSEDDALRVSCKPKNNTGNLCELVTGPGQILAIRQTINSDQDGLPILEEYKLEQNGKVIDGDGSYLVNVPMNLDYIYTNEFGEQAISNDPKIGIPTKGKYRFKFKWENEGGLQNEFLRANFFVPNVKEHGWTTSSYSSDPIYSSGETSLSFTVNPLNLVDLFIIPSSGDLVLPVLTNVSSFQVAISPTLIPLSPQPYLGDLTNGITGLSAGNAIFITFVPTDPTLPSSISYTGINGAPNTTFSIPGGPISGAFIITTGGGMIFDNTVNTSSYSIQIDSGSGPQPYYGDIQLIPVNSGDVVYVTPTFIDPNTPATVSYTLYSQNYFDLLRSYTFSLDWDDYADPTSAINCEDTFYEFNYNKVYTTAMFLDRYKNGIGRAKHLGIKEIDNRTCKSTVNTFPVNDVIRNFDFLFFIFNLLMSILVFPIMTLLFVAHFIAWVWPVLKYLLIVLGFYFGYIAIREGIDTINSIFEQAAVAIPGGPIFNIGVILRVIVQILGIVFKVGLSLAFIGFTIAYLIPIDNFPRIGLPMLAYPDCSTCDCECGNADMSEANDITTDSVNGEIQEAGQSASGVDLPVGVPTSASTSNSFLVPIQDISTFNGEHPNLSQMDGFDTTDGEGGYFYCNAVLGQYKSFTYSLSDQDIESNVVTAAILGYQRLISGSESLDIGNDQTGIPDKKYLHAPQPFVFAADRASGVNFRTLSYPISETYAQKLNEFNLRQKYFDGVNQMEVKFNFNNNPGKKHYDQPLILLAKPGTISQLGIGQIFSFQDPKLSNCNKNITGATFYNSFSGNTDNQFGNHSLTGTSQTGLSVPITVKYASTSNNTINVPVYYDIIQTGSSENFLSRPIDIEYFQVITGYTYSNFLTNASYTTSDPTRFPQKYLNHDSVIVYENECNPYLNNSPNYINNPDVITNAAGYGNYEIIIIARGVDPYSEKQRNKYDLSRIFGNTSYGSSSAIIEGDYYLNVPIQGYTSGNKPKSHNIVSNNTAPNLYFESYNFKISPSYTDVNGFIRNEYSGFTSTLPYYYLCSDDFTVLGVTSYTPDAGFPTINNLSSNGYNVNSGQRGYVLPTPLVGPNPNNATSNYYFAGGSFIGSPNPSNTYLFGTTFGSSSGDKEIYWPWTPIRRYAVYSPAYYKYIGSSLTSIQYNVSFATPTTPQYLVMRSDRIPTSTKTQDGYYGNNTGYGLHQNNFFTYYKGSQGASPSIGVAPDISAGQTVYDESPLVQSLTSTLTCDGMVSLQCYQGTGTGITVNQNCDVPSDRVKQGCYCLLNKKYLLEYGDDVKLFLEWKTRFTMTFAACRGVFSQTFQNNWINGVLYMFTFNKSTTYKLNQPDEPIYNYCKDTVIFNKFNNGFYYRSSPWDGTDFIGVDSPPPSPFIPVELITEYPGLGYNNQRIQFPTTVMDLGPRDSFISEICNDGNFNGYIADQIRSTSYKDNSDIIQMGFISRLLNQSVIDQMFPVGNPNGGSSEGKGIIQFFNSNRDGERIDGDIAQALSINSEWRVTPYLNENYRDFDLFIGDDGVGAKPRPVFGVFFSSSTEEYQYRRRLSPGIETYASSCGNLTSYYGYPNDQVVPHYKWKIAGASSNIFGTENNNWVTTSNQNVSGSGFYSQEYQNLDFNNPLEYYQAGTNHGFITRFNINGNPVPYIANPNPTITHGTPNGNPIIVGAPFFFYFGLNNGNTAIDKFIKLYVETAE